jgi:hypothetical protein
MPTGVALTIAAGAESHDQVGAKLSCPRHLTIEQAERPRAEIHHREGDGAAGAAGAQLQHGRSSDGVLAERLGERGAKARPVGVMAGCPPGLVEHHRVDRADLLRFGRDLVEQGEYRFLERKSDVDAGKAGRACRRQHVGQLAPSAVLGIHQMIVSAGAQRREAVFVQGGRQ